MAKIKLKLLMDRERIYLYPWYFADELITEAKNKKFFGRTVSQAVNEFKKGHIYFYNEVKTYDSIGRHFLNKVVKDKKFYKQVEKNTYSFSDELLSFCKSIDRTDLTKISSVKLYQLYATYAEKLKALRKWGWVPVFLDGLNISHLTDHINEKLNEHLRGFSAKEISQYYSVLSSSEKMSEVRQEEHDRLKLLVAINAKHKKAVNIIKNKNISSIKKELKNNYPAVWQKILLHTKKYQWLPYAYVGPVMSPDNTLELMKESLKENTKVRKTLKELEKHYRELPEKRKAIIKKIKLTPELTYLLTVSRFFMYLKDYRKGIFQKSYVYMDKVMEEISRRLNLSFVEVKYLTSQEIERLLKTKKPESRLLKNIHQRPKYCVAITTKGKTNVFIGNQARGIIKEIMKQEKGEQFKVIDEIKGLTAYSGKVKGTVKVVAVVKDMKKVKPGDILVSPATNPDLIVAMKKAAAFVTDMGGVISHAAIVSRELKKPCIVGTKIATKVLKDGDLVEVDADKGVVKIIK